MSDPGAEYDEGVDYKAMYLRMARAAEEAIRILIQAQRECENAYISAGGDIVVPFNNPSTE